MPRIRIGMKHCLLLLLLTLTAAVGVGQDAEDIVLDPDAKPVLQVPGDALINGRLNLNDNQVANIGSVESDLTVNTERDAALSLNQEDGSWNYVEFNQSGTRHAWLGLNDENDLQVHKEQGGEIALTGTKVGIGTDSPDAALDVEAGDVNVSGNALQSVGGIQPSGSGLIVNSGQENVDFRVRTVDNQNAFFVDGDENSIAVGHGWASVPRMAIYPTDSTIWGNTQTATLKVRGREVNLSNSPSRTYYSSFGGGEYVSQDGSSYTISEAATLHVGNAPTTGSEVGITRPYSLLVDDQTRFNADVGIGTAPDYNLHIRQGNDEKAQLRVETVDNSGGKPSELQLVLDAPNAGNQGNDVGQVEFWSEGGDIGDHPIAAIRGQVVGAAENDGKLHFQTTSDADGTGLHNRMTIENNGQVGIGTTNPRAALEVTGGNIRIDGNGNDLHLRHSYGGSQSIIFEGGGNKAARITSDGDADLRLGPPYAGNPVTIRRNQGGVKSVHSTFHSDGDLTIHDGDLSMNNNDIKNRGNYWWGRMGEDGGDVRWVTSEGNEGTFSAPSDGSTNCDSSDLACLHRDGSRYTVQFEIPSKYTKNWGGVDFESGNAGPGGMCWATTSGDNEMRAGSELDEGARLVSGDFNGHCLGNIDDCAGVTHNGWGSAGTYGVVCWLPGG
jgi:adhesin HecA-like repeat protein